MPNGLTLTLQAPVVPQRRIPEIDELKGGAILLVVLYHAGGVLTWNNHLHGDLGVDIFVILSGFGLAFGKRSESTFASFFRRRLWRLMPAYWVILTLCLFANIHFLQLDYSWGNIAAHYAALHDFCGDQYALAINDSFWFITFILFLYACYWLLRDKLDRLDVFLFQSGLLCASVALSLFFLNQSGLMGHVGFRVAGFFLGMVAGQVLKTGRCQLPVSVWSAAGLVLYTYVPYTQGIFFHPPLVGAALILGYVWLARPLLAVHTPQAIQLLSFLGIYSFEIFLLHQPLMRHYNIYLHGRWLNVAQPGALSLTVGMAIALGLTVIVSVELHRLLARVTTALTV